MRHPLPHSPSRRSRATGLAVASAAAGALVLGSAGAVVAAAPDHGSPAAPGTEHTADATTATDAAEAPRAQELAGQVQSLDKLLNGIGPVADLMRAVLSTEDGRLSRGEADAHAQAIQQALAPFTQGAGQFQEAGRGRHAADDRAGERAGTDDGPQGKDDGTAPRAEARALQAQAADTLRDRAEQLLAAATSDSSSRAAVDDSLEETIQAALALAQSVLGFDGLPLGELPLGELPATGAGTGTPGQADASILPALPAVQSAR